MNLLGTALGWIMRMIYNIVQSYGISILLFTLLVKLITLPSTYKQQVTQGRIALLSKKIEGLKKSFANNPQKFQEEQNKLYTQEGINPGSGCLGTFLTLFILLGVYSVVMKPLTFILNIGSETITKATELLQKATEGQNIDTSRSPELMLIKYVKSNPEYFSGMDDFIGKVSNFKNTFLGFDLGATPTMHPESWTAAAVVLAMLPLLAFLVQTLLTVVTQRHTKKTNPSMQSMGVMNLMIYLMPVMTIWLGFKLPAGVNFYWIVNSLISLLMQVGIYGYLNPKRMQVINEKEKEKQLAKGPGWMQRMMEASAAMQNEQNNIRGNRTKYADGDDGMSRKERSEYDRKLIEAARRRAALKYGEALPEEDSDSSEDDE